MKYTLLLSFTITCLFTQAQNWCPAGASWYYSYFDMTSEGYEYLYYNSDTTINNISCKQISGALHETIIDYQHDTVIYYHNTTVTIENKYTYSSGDTVYFLDGNIFKSYFYFNAHVGDTLQIPNTNYTYNADSVVHTVVDSTGTLQLNGQNLRYYVFHIIDYCGMWIGYSEKVVERMGILSNHLIPYWHCVTDDIEYSLRCYEDNSLPVISETPGTPCDYLRYTGVEKINNEIMLNIYPNPTNNYIILTADVSIGSELQILDGIGKVVAKYTVSNSEYYIPVAALQDGLYIIKVIDNRKGQIGIRKFVKQQ